MKKPAASLPKKATTISAPPSCQTRGEPQSTVLRLSDTPTITKNSGAKVWISGRICSSSRCASCGLGANQRSSAGMPSRCITLKRKCCDSAMPAAKPPMISGAPTACASQENSRISASAMVMSRPGVAARWS